MADVSYFRTPARGPARAMAPVGGGLSARRRRRRGPWIAGVLLLVVLCVLAAAAVVVKSSKAKLTSDPSALAKVGMPIGGGTIEHVSVVRAKDQHPIPVKLVGDPVILPKDTVAAAARYQIQVIVKRPGYLSWLTGKTETLTKTVTTPSSKLRSQYVTLHHGTLRIHFKRPVRVVAYGAQGHLTRHTYAHARSAVTLPHATTAGTTYVAAQVQPWETSSAEALSWFPAGTKATAVARPAPGGKIKSSTPITLTFSKPISKVLGSHMPTVTPAGAGSWHRISSHAITFRPSGYGYGLDQKVSIALPDGVRLAGGTQTGSASDGTWSVPAGSTVRLQQILAELGYLPLTFNYAGAGPGTTVADQEAAAVDPPKGTFGWRWSSTPAALRGQWQAGAYGTMTKGAVMTFEDQHGMTADGVAGPQVWKALITAMLKGQKNTAGYTFVQVSEGSPESLQLWHDGATKLSGIPVNTGVAGAATATGTYPVFEHVPVTTMTGTNVDGSHYSDPGIKWVSYFNGGDALHAYPRASYGFPQSNGCVEMTDGDAAAVYPYTPIGTLVDVQ